RYLGSVPAATNSCSNAYCAVQFGTADMSVQAATGTSCNVCNVSAGIEPLNVSPKCEGGASPDMVPAGWVQATQNSGALSFIALSVTYHESLSDWIQSGDSAALHLVQVCYANGVPQVVNSARATTRSAATPATTTTPKPFLLKDCTK